MKISFTNLFKLNWRYRKYRIWIVNTTVTCDLYTWDNWRYLLPELNELIAITKEPAFIRTYQSYDHENKWLGFGRMKWNEENNIRWTTKYRNDTTRKYLNFYMTEIWAPDWNKVRDTGMPPDVFVALYNYSEIDGLKEGVIVALPESRYKKNHLKFSETIAQIALHIPGSKIHQATRDWWQRTAKRNNIENLNPQELKKIIDQG